MYWIIFILILISFIAIAILDFRYNWSDGILTCISIMAIVLTIMLIIGITPTSVKEITPKEQICFHQPQLLNTKILFYFNDGTEITLDKIKYVNFPYNISKCYKQEYINQYGNTFRTIYTFETLNEECKQKIKIEINR